MAVPGFVSNRNLNANLRSYTVRPPDQNQHGTTRPHLTSASRRAGSENILAKLERDSQGWQTWLPSLPVLAYGAGGVLILVLLASLIWVARQNSLKPRPLAAASKAAVVSEQLPPPLLERNDEPSLPPLVMLKPTPASLPDAPPRPHAIVHVALPPLAPAVLRAPAPRPRKAPVKVETARAEPPPVDTDVALLSAILLHSNSHAAERAAFDAPLPCRAKKCAGAAKTTD
jgi:hypothetical protein